MAIQSLTMPGKRFVISVPFVWLILFFLFPWLAIRLVLRKRPV